MRLDEKETVVDRKREFRAGKGQHPPGLSVERLAIEALSFFGTRPEEGQRFFAWSGLDAGTVRSAAAEPHFALGVLDYFAENLASLERFCDSAGLLPGDVIRCHETLKTRGLTSHDDL